MKLIVIRFLNHNLVPVTWNKIENTRGLSKLIQWLKNWQRYMHSCVAKLRMTNKSIKHYIGNLRTISSSCSTRVTHCVFWLNRKTRWYCVYKMSQPSKKSTNESWNIVAIIWESYTSTIKKLVSAVNITNHDDCIVHLVFSLLFIIVTVGNTFE